MLATTRAVSTCGQRSEGSWASCIVGGSRFDQDGHEDMNGASSSGRQTGYVANFGIVRKNWEGEP